MNIDSLTPCPGTSGKLKLVLSDGKQYKLSQFLAADYNLYPGKPLSEEEFQALLAAISKEQTRERAVRMISQSALSERLLKERLCQKGAAPQDAEETVFWLHELRLTDDRAAAMQIASSAARKGYGKKRIESILYEKKIPKELWQDALSDLPEPDDAIDRFLHRKLDGRAVDEKLLHKTADALLRRGHSYHDISAAITRYRDDLELTAPDSEDDL